MYRFGVAAILVLMSVMAVTFGITAGQEDDASAQIEEFKTHDDLLLDVANLVPEFGGKFISEDGDILYVHVLEGSEETLDPEHAKRAIEGSFTNRVTEGRELRLIPAKYSMHQLHEWYRQIREVIRRNLNVTFTDLQEGHNRIEIGVASTDAVKAVEVSLASLDLPTDAIEVLVTGPPVPLSHSLQDRATGGVMEAGYQIGTRYVDVEGRTLRGNCTLGFVVYRSEPTRGEAGFITAGHCTEDDWDGGVDHTKFYQPDASEAANLVGKEKIDPAFSSNLKGCPDEMVCRWSDSAFVRFTFGADWNAGKIARTRSIGGINVNHSSSFRIVAENPSSTVGQIVYKVGRTTGFTSAKVRNTCVEYRAPENRRLLCQTSLTGSSDPFASDGDSGAPVFRITDSPNTGDVELMGILYATGESIAYFSPVGQIYLDLGSTDKWEACYSSFRC